MSPAATVKRGKVDLDAIAGRCEFLKLVHAAQCLPELVEEASREDLSPVHSLDRVLQQEIERKDERRIATSLKLSGLPLGQTLEGFDWTFQPRADRTKLDALEEQELSNLGRAREIIGRWVEFYNRDRLHASLNYLPPAEYWAGDPEARMEERREKLERGRKHREMVNRARLQEAA